MHHGFCRLLGTCEKVIWLFGSFFAEPTLVDGNGELPRGVNFTSRMLIYTASSALTCHLHVLETCAGLGTYLLGTSSLQIQNTSNVTERDALVHKKRYFLLFIVYY